MMDERYVLQLVPGYSMEFHATGCRLVLTSKQQAGEI